MIFVSLLFVVVVPVLDMARHVPLYRALLELLRAISTCTTLVPLLLPLSGDVGHKEEEEEDEEPAEGHTSVGMLLAKMKTCVDTYTNRLRFFSSSDKTPGTVPQPWTYLSPEVEPGSPPPSGSSSRWTILTRLLICPQGQRKTKVKV